MKTTVGIYKHLIGKKIPTIDEKSGWIKIMAFVDNWYMFRYKGCLPFTCSEKELKIRIETKCKPLTSSK